MLATLLAAGGVLDPKLLIEKGGLWLLVLIVFAESGLLIGFFLPGDSLLFIAGFLTSPAAKDLPAFASVAESFHPNLAVMLVCLFAAAVAGDQVGYLIGRRAGPALFRREDSRLFKQQYVLKAEAFFERYGPKTVLLARFVPIVRTFAPVVAGVGRMHYRTFVLYNVVGGFVWAVGVTLLGHFLGRIALVRDHIELAILAVVAISLLPVIVEVARHRLAKRTTTAEVAP